MGEVLLNKQTGVSRKYNFLLYLNLFLGRFYSYFPVKADPTPLFAKFTESLKSFHIFQQLLLNLQ